MEADTTFAYREAKTQDIAALQKVRNAVKENVLSNPQLVTDADVEQFINVRGKGWVCTSADTVVGFSIADLADDNIWALFVLPEFEGYGIGSHLHDIMLEWYFMQGKQTVWLSTEPLSRADRFYNMKGWCDAGSTKTGEHRYTLSSAQWTARRSIK